MNEIAPENKRTRQKEISNRFISRPVDFLIKHNFTPNKLSFIGLTLTIIASFLIAIKWMYISIWMSWMVPFFLGLAGAFDLFDGEVARRTEKKTQTGAFLDSILDRFSDAILILGLIYGGLINYLLGFSILFLVIMISYIRSRAENEGVDMKGIGFMERAERILFLEFSIIIELSFYFITLLVLGDPLTIFNPFITRVPVTPIFLIAIIILTFTLIYTVLQRLIFTFKTLNANKESI